MGITRISFPNFGGLDQSKRELPLSMTASAQNVDTRKGTLRRARGYTEYAPAPPEDAVGLIKFHKRNGAAYEDILIAASDGALYAWRDEAWSLMLTRSSGDYSYINYQLNGEDVVIMTNGSDFPVKWDGTTAQELPDVPKFSQITLHYERMWGTGIKGEPDRVYYSASFDPTDFTTPEKSGFIDIPTFDGGGIIALKTVFDDVVVFKKENVFRIYGTYPGVYEVSRVYGVVGPVAPNSIVSTGERVYFLSGDGLCVYDGLKVTPFALPQLADLIARINPAYASRAVAAYHDSAYYLALPLDDSVENNAVIEFDEARGTFMLRYGLHVHAFLEFGGRLLMSDGHGVFTFDEGDDYGGAPITAFWETPDTDLDKADERKLLKKLYAYARGDAIRIRVEADGVTREKTFELGDMMKLVRMNIGARGRRFKVRYENVDGGDFELTPADIIAETSRE